MHRHTPRRVALAALLIVGLIAPATSAGAATDDDPSDFRQFQQFSADADGEGSVEAAQEEGFEVVADGLSAPRGVDIDENGDVYVIHAGDPQPDPGPCVTQPWGVECYMETGEVVRVRDGAQEVVVDGLPAIGDAEQNFGPSDVSVDPDGNLYMIIGLGAEEEGREAFGEAGQNLGWLFRAEADNDGFDEAEPIVDVAAFEFEHNWDEGDEADSNPYGVVALDDHQYVVDAGGNTLLRTTDDGGIDLEAVFPPNPQVVPPGFPGEGEEFLADSVPTGVTIGPDGAVYATELPGGFEPDEAARLWRYEDELEVFDEGFTMAMDLDWGPDGSLYVLQLFAFVPEDFEGPPPPGRLVRVTPDGDHEIIAEEGLFLPAGLAVGEDGIYVSNCHMCGAEAGHVVRIDLPEEPEGACPEDVPSAGFTDVPADSVHLPAIDCMAWWEIALGVTPTTYQPAGRLTRAQMASFLARAIHASDATLPAEAESPFTDTQGSVHEAAIAALADVGIVEGFGDNTYRPQLQVTRDQKATMLVRAVEYVLEEELPVGEDRFTDDDGSVHEENINKAAEAGLTVGVTQTLFNPRAAVRRDQAATFVARAMDLFVFEGRASLPAPSPEE